MESSKTVKTSPHVSRLISPAKNASKAACAEQRAAGKTSKKARRLEKAAEKAKAVAARQASERAYSWM